MLSPLRSRLRDDDRGSLSLFVVVVFVALLVTIGLVVDGGGKIRALQRADAVAAQAARAGGQAIVASTANTTKTSWMMRVRRFSGPCCGDSCGDFWLVVDTMPTLTRYHV